nr:YjcQ family protein [uncultured Ruminococcus sp.]
MNDNFKCIYKILRTLEKAMDCPEFDLAQIDHNTLEISKERWARYLEMMADIGYIKGIRVYEDVTGGTVVDIRVFALHSKDLNIFRKIQ